MRNKATQKIVKIEIDRKGIIGPRTRKVARPAQHEQHGIESTNDSVTITSFGIELFQAF